MRQQFPSLRVSWSGHISRALFSLTTVLLLSNSIYQFEVVAQTARSDQQSANSPIPLELGKSIQRTLAPTDVHAYQIVLAKDQFAEFTVDQQGIDIAVWTFDPNGKKTSEVDAFKLGDPEGVVLLGDEPGAYRIEIHTTLSTGPAGDYKITLTESHPANEKEKNGVAGGILIAAGIQLERKADADSVRQAIEKYQQALLIWRKANDLKWEANTLYLIANDYIYLANRENALDHATRAVEIAKLASKEGDEEEKLKAAKVEAWSIEILGKVYGEFGDKKKGLEYFKQALALRRKIKDRTGEISTLNQIATAYKYIGEAQKALDVYEESNTLLNELIDLPKRATVLNNICVLYDDLGEYKKALDYCEKGRAISRDLKDTLGTATVVNNLGNTHANLGEFQEALDFYNESYELYKRLENRRGQGIELSNIGWLYAMLGDHEKAQEFYDKSLEIFKASGDQFRAGNVLGNMGSNYAAMNDYRKALEINEQTLVLRRAVNNIDGEATTLSNIGNCYAKLGEPDKARDHYKQAIALQRQRNPRQLSIALKNLGILYRDQGDLQNSLVALNESLQISRSIGDPSSEAASSAELAQLERDRGNLTEAKRLIDAALASVESLRINLKSHQLRTSYAASVRRYHELNVDILMRLHKANPNSGFANAALVASENGRARSLVELLTESIARIRTGVDPALVERERTLRQRIAVSAEKQMRLLSANHSETDLASAAKELDALTLDYEAVQTKIRQTSPRYAALIQPEQIDLKHIQSELLDKDTLLLEYSLGEDKSYLWTVASDAVRTYELPGRKEIEAAARRVYDLITLPERSLPDDMTAQRASLLNHADTEYPAAAANLSRILLGPAFSDLGHKRLLIVGEGVLQYVPFAALPEPGPANSTAPLVVNHEIVNLPSASVLRVLRQEAARRTAPSKTIAAFADPVFDINDPRLAGDETTDRSRLGYSGEVRRSAEESGIANFQRLRFSREEANQIMKYVSKTSSMEALDFSANHAAATSDDLRNYRVLHFATHGIINSRHPELSGIVLSLVDKDGKAENGFLRLYDIYNMNLTADLVVLSACQTALGKDIKGEGLIGLARAFMYAGSTRVVASLWQAEDRATAVLMGHFYENLLAKKLSVPAALRNAQLAMLQNKRWQKPRYWAAFTIQGEWK
jgi:CHAT domain-containing protein/tetratricopeptide (TPR) repeat protein